MMLFFFAAADAETVPAGTVIENAAVVDITADGFDAVEGLIPSLLPSDLAVDDLGADEGWYAYSVSNLQVGITVNSAQITPGDGVLDINASLNISVNDVYDPFYLYYYALWIVEGTCDTYVDPFPVDVHTTLSMNITGADSGTPTLDVALGEIDVAYSLEGDAIHYDNCGIGDLETVLNWFSLSINDLILGAVDPYLQDAIADIGPTLETTIEDAFSAATINQELAVLDTTLTVNLYPRDVEITPEALRLYMSGSMDAPAADCVASYDPGGSTWTDGDAPTAGESPSGVFSPVHGNLLLSDDFGNQALYAVWRGGVLCYTVGADLGIPLDTSLLSSLTGGAFDTFFPEARSVTIVTRPEAPPTMAYGGTNDLDLNLDGLNLDFYAELDGRQARVVGIGLNGTAGVNLPLDGSTGSLGVELDLGTDHLIPSVSYNELAPDANETIASSFSSVFGSLVGSLVGTLIGDLSFALPSFSGLGLSQLQATATGTSEDWLGLYFQLGSVTYGDGSSCGGCGGGDTGDTGDTGAGSADGCSSGTSCSILGPNPFAFGVLGTLVILRRRRAV